MLWEGTLNEWILWPQCTENFDSGATGPLMVCSHRMRYCGFPNRMRYYGRDRVLMKRSSSLTSRRSRDAGSGRDACAVRCQGWTGSWTSDIREEQGQSFILVSSLESDVCLYNYLCRIRRIRCNWQRKLILRLPIFNLRVHVYILCKRSQKKQIGVWEAGPTVSACILLFFYVFFPRFLYQESSRAHKYYKQRISDLRAQTNTDRGNDADTEGADGEDTPGAADRKKQRKKKRSRWGPQEGAASSAEGGGAQAPPPPPPGKNAIKNCSFFVPTSTFLKVTN